MSKHILSVSCDATFLFARHELLVAQGYEVTSTFGFVTGLCACEQGPFDLLLLAESIPPVDRDELTKAFRTNNFAPVLVVRRGGERVEGIGEYSTVPHRDELLLAVRKILNERCGARTTPEEDPARVVA